MLIPFLLYKFFVEIYNFNYTTFYEESQQKRKKSFYKFMHFTSLQISKFVL